MDLELLVIFGFVLLISSLALSAAHMFHRRVVEHEERKLELKARIAEAQREERSLGNAGIEHIEDRLRVLERIVTDPQADLSRQIEDLRAASTRREEAL